MLEGAYVFIAGRRHAELDAAAKEIGGAVTAIPSDVSNLADLDGLFAAIKEQRGRLDVLFANAGGGAFVPLERVTEAHFDKYFGINVKGTLFTVQKALPLMPPGSAIVITGSMVSIKGIPAFGVYAATKAALRSFARTWAVDLKGRNIRVNVISPGTVVTPGYKTELGLSDEQLEQFKAAAAETTPLGRTGTADEIAKACLLLPKTAGSLTALSSSWTAEPHKSDRLIPRFAAFHDRERNHDSMPWQYTHGEPHPELVRPDGPAHGNRGACPCDVRKGIPSVVGVAPQAALGGALLAYGPSRPDLDRLVAVYIDRVLRGARPSELPVEQVWKHDLVINRKTAKALGLTIPPSLLARADQVIE